MPVPVGLLIAILLALAPGGAVLRPASAGEAHATEGAGTAPLFPILEGGRWGFIDSTGHVSIAPRFESIVAADIEWRVGLTLPRGLRPRPPDLFMSPSLEPESSAVFGVRIAGRWGFVDRSGRAVVPPRFDQVGRFSEGLAPVRVGRQWGFVDRFGRVAIAPRFEEVGSFRGGLAVVIEGERSGVIDTLGYFVLRPRFERVVAFDSIFFDNRAVIALEGKKGYACRAGTIAVPPLYRDASRFSEGLAAVEMVAGHGYIDTTGRVVIAPRFEFAAPFDRGLALVRQGGMCGFIDRTGSYVVEPRFDEAGSFSGADIAPVRRGRSFGWINRSGRWIESAFFELQRIDDSLRLAKSDGRIGIVNGATGNLLRSFAWGSLGVFSEGLASARNSGTRYGFIDLEGTLVIATRFDQVDRFRHGLCRVAAADTLGYVDRAGRWLWRGFFPGYGRRYGGTGP